MTQPEKRLSETLGLIGVAMEAAANHGEIPTVAEMRTVASLIRQSAARALSMELDLVDAAVTRATLTATLDALGARRRPGYAGGTPLPPATPIAGSWERMPGYLRAIRTVMSGAARRGEPLSPHDAAAVSTMLEAIEGWATAVIDVVRERDDLLAVARDLDVVARAPDERRADGAVAVPPQGARIIPWPIIVKPIPRGDGPGAA